MLSFKTCDLNLTSTKAICTAHIKELGRGKQGGFLNSLQSGEFAKYARTVLFEAVHCYLMEIVSSWSAAVLLTETDAKRRIEEDG